MRRSPERHPVLLDYSARFDAGYTQDVRWNHMAYLGPYQSSGGGWFFFNTTRIQVLISNGKVIVQDVGWNTAQNISTFHEDGRFTLTAEEIGQLNGGN